MKRIGLATATLTWLGILVAFLATLPAALHAQSQLAFTSLEEEPPRLQLDEAKRIDLQFAEPTSVQALYRELGSAYGLDVVFHPQMKEQELAIELRDVTFREALRLIEQSTGLFSVVSTEKSFVVAPDSPKFRRDLEPLAVRTFPLEHITGKQMMTILRAIAGVKRVALDSDLGAVVIRDRPAVLDIAQRLIETYDRPQGEMEVAVALYHLDRSARRQFGVGAGPQGRVAPEVVEQLANAEGARKVAEARLSFLDGKGASLSISELVPTTDQGAAQTVKLALELTGRVHGTANEVTLGVALDGTLLDHDDSRVQSREMTSELSLDHGQSYLLSGLFLVAPGGELSLVSPAGKRVEASELALVLTPRITREGSIAKRDRRPLWVGTESRVDAPSLRLTRNEEEAAKRE